MTDEGSGVAGMQKCRRSRSFAPIYRDTGLSFSLSFYLSSLSPHFLLHRRQFLDQGPQERGHVGN